MSSEAASLLPDQRRFGRYKLLYRFASGGMAHIYLARFTGSDGFEKLVAIKLIHEHLTEDPDFVRMFIDEARLASAISHANVAQVIELGRIGRTHYIAMEYVEGESVSALMRRTKPSLRLCARVIADAAAGLHAAHELKTRQGELRHVVHRDVSPQNLLISYDGQVKVVDFGVARARGMLHDTDGGTVKGKFAYMAPEQANAESVDRRADVFSLGIVLYEMSTRKRLFKGQNSAETLRKMMQDEIRPPSKLVGPGYPSSLEKIVLKALQRDPDKRFQTARELQGALEQFIIESGGAFLPSDVGELMTELFADHIRTKRELMESCEQDCSASVPDVDLGSVSTSMPTLATGHTALEDLPEGSDQVPTRSVPLVPIVAGLAVVLALGAALYFAFLRPNATRQVAASAQDAGAAAQDATPALTISIKISASPRNATIVFEGKPVANPFSAVREPSEGMARAVVSAPGYKDKQLDVPLFRSGSWLIGLQRDLPAAAKPDAKPAAEPAVKKKPRRRRGTRRGTRRGSRRSGTKRRGIADDDVFKDNPYGR